MVKIKIHMHVLIISQAEVLYKNTVISINPPRHAFSSCSETVSLNAPLGLKCFDVTTTESPLSATPPG